MVNFIHFESANKKEPRFSSWVGKSEDPPQKPRAYQSFRNPDPHASSHDRTDLPSPCPVVTHDMPSMMIFRGGVGRWVKEKPQQPPPSRQQKPFKAHTKRQRAISPPFSAIVAATQLLFVLG
ncbi:hypothetical protein ACFX2J_006288 [Malus domestica]